MKYLESAIGKAEKVVRLDWRDERPRSSQKIYRRRRPGAASRALGALSRQNGRALFFAEAVELYDLASGGVFRLLVWRRLCTLGVCGQPRPRAPRRRGPLF